MLTVTSAILIERPGVVDAEDDEAKQVRRARHQTILGPTDE
jgi:hypothetical protein